VRDTGTAWNFRRRFAMARPLFFERAEARRAKGGLGPRRKIPLFLWREESKALCLESFVLKTVLSVWRQLSRMSHVLGFEDVVELGLGKQVFFEYQFVDAKSSPLVRAPNADALQPMANVDKYRFCRIRRKPTLRRGHRGVLPHRYPCCAQ